MQVASVILIAWFVVVGVWMLNHYFNANKKYETRVPARASTCANAKAKAPTSALEASRGRAGVPAPVDRAALAAGGALAQLDTDVDGSGGCQ